MFLALTGLKLKFENLIWKSTPKIPWGEKMGYPPPISNLKLTQNFWEKSVKKMSILHEVDTATTDNNQHPVRTQDYKKY